MDGWMDGHLFVDVRSDIVGRKKRKIGGLISILTRFSVLKLFCHCFYICIHTSSNTIPAQKTEWLFAHGAEQWLF